MLSAISNDDDYEFNAFIEAEIRRIEVEKWIQGVNQHSDPGDDFIIEWVNNNAEYFRRAWGQSLCKTCRNHSTCGYKVVSACDDYEQTGWKQ